MDKLPFDITDIDAREVHVLANTWQLLKAKFKVSIAEDHTFDIRDFELFSNYTAFSIGGSLLINHPEKGCYLTFVKVATPVKKGKGQVFIYKYQVWASATLRNEFGRVIITREAVADKILNVSHPTELHFKDDMTFTRKFNVIADDKEQSAPAMTKAFRNALMNIKTDDFVIEIVDSTLMMGNTHPIEPKQVVYFAEIASKLSTVK